MSGTPQLHLEGLLVATAEVVDTYRQDGDAWHHMFLFRSEDGYRLVTLARSETYSDTGCRAGGIVDVVVEHADDVGRLEELVTRRFLTYSDAWWQLLDSGRHDDDDLHARWAPERMRRDLDRASIFDRDLALTTAYLDGRLSAPGRSELGWREAAVDAMTEHLEELGWQVAPERRSLAQSAKAGAVFSGATEILGVLRVRRYGWEAAVLVRVDDCGEIYPRLAQPDEVVDSGVRLVNGPDPFAACDVELAERFTDLAPVRPRDPNVGLDR